MVVGFAVVGGAAVVAAIKNYGDYGDYSAYSNHSDYSNYSDAAERERRRKEQEQADQLQKVNSYKIDPVNQYLDDLALRAADGDKVSLDAVKREGDRKIAAAKEKKLQDKTAALQQDIKEIDALVQMIDRVLEDEQ